MKLVRYISVLLFMLVVSQTTMAQDQESLLIGKWTFNYNASFMNINKESKSTFDLLPEAQRTSIKKLYTNRQLVFQPDGICLMILSDGRVITTNWRLDPTKKVIEFRTSNKGVFRQGIRLLSGEGLVLDLMGENVSSALFTQLHYNKIKN